MTEFQRARSDDEKDTRRRALLDAALAVFAETGFAAARMDDIARRAGVSKGTVYLYFDSKEALFEALLQAMVVPQIDQLEALAASDADPREVMAMVLGVAEHIITQTQLPTLLKLVIGESGRVPHLVRAYREHVVDRGIAALSALFERGLAARGVAGLDPTNVARLFIAPVLMSAIWRSVLEPSGAAPIDVGAQLRLHGDVLARGLGLAEPEDTR